MKTLIASVFALALLGASAGIANADVVGAHVGPVGVGIGIHGHHHHHHHHYRR